MVVGRKLSLNPIMLIHQAPCSLMHTPTGLTSDLQKRCLCWLSLKTLLWWLFQMYALCIGFELRDTYRIISNFSFIPFLWINNLNPLLLTASFISMPQYFNKQCYSAEHLHRESSWKANFHFQHKAVIYIQKTQENQFSYTSGEVWDYWTTVRESIASLQGKLFLTLSSYKYIWGRKRILLRILSVCNSGRIHKSYPGFSFTGKHTYNPV